jgi:malyl-CoA/(S)-citramalyl-CoA lyase
MSLGAADFAASMGMQTTGIGGTQEGYYMLPPRDAGTDAGAQGPRPPHYPDPWHGVTAAIVAACRANGVLPVDGPFGDFSDPDGFTAQARRAATLGMVGKWAIHPSQIGLANAVFTPDEARVAEAREILAAMQEAAARGQGAVTYKGRLIDIASVRQARVIVEMADLLAAG